MIKEERKIRYRLPSKIIHKSNDVIGAEYLLKKKIYKFQ